RAQSDISTLSEQGRENNNNDPGASSFFRTLCFFRILVTLHFSVNPMPFSERGGTLRGCLDLFSGRFPAFIFGGSLGSLLPVFHFHEVTREDLDPKLRHLAENAYRSVTADEIAAYVRGNRSLAGRAVALCFDDAWKSLSTVAAPLLRQYGLTAIVYVIPGR